MGKNSVVWYEKFFISCHEKHTQIPKYKENITLLHHLINYQLRFPPLDSKGRRSSHQSYKTYKKDCNNWLLLTWEISDLRYTINFLYLSISINTQGDISLQTYQKAMELYMYLSFHSTQPTRALQGFIIVFLKFCW